MESGTHVQLINISDRLGFWILLRTAAPFWGRTIQIWSNFSINGTAVQKGVAQSALSLGYQLCFPSPLYIRRDSDCSSRYVFGIYSSQYRGYPTVRCEEHLTSFKTDSCLVLGTYQIWMWVGVVRSQNGTAVSSESSAAAVAGLHRSCNSNTWVCLILLYRYQSWWYLSAVPGTLYNNTYSCVTSQHPKDGNRDYYTAAVKFPYFKGFYETAT